MLLILVGVESEISLIHPPRWYKLVPHHRWDLASIQ
jgi:hypothetical protein